MRGFLSCTLHHILLGQSNQEVQDGRDTIHATGWEIHKKYYGKIPRYIQDNIIKMYLKK